MPLQIENLSKRYGNTWALRDVDINAADGAVLGVFGGTGSGKTTLLKCISGSEAVNGGTINTNGAAVYFAEDKKESGLSALFGRKGSEISVGEARIAAAESALDSDAPILLLDEPFAGIDAIHRERLAEKIRSAAASGRTVIVASSYFPDIASVCDRVAVLVGGYVHQTGFAQEVYENPETSAVASIVGVNNLFAARRLTSTNADMPEFFTIDGEHRLFAQPTEKHKLGAINQNVTLAIRPEHVSITFGASFPEDNLLKAVVTAIRFHGETTLVELDADGLKLAARVFRVVGLNIGEECMIGMPPHRILVLKS